MSTTDPASLKPGLPYPTAVAMATEIDAGTASAAKLCQAGISGPAAVELARQMVAGTGEVTKLMACGFAPALATAIKTAIDA